MFTIGSKKIETEVTREDFLYLVRKIADIDSLHNFINEQPVYPEWRERIQKMEFLRAVQGTVALEGSSLEIEDVERIANRVEPSISEKDKEAENALLAYEFIQEWSFNNENEPITESVIRQIHTIVTRGINYYLNTPGEYRNQIVQFGYPSQKSTLRTFSEVQEAMGSLAHFINADNSGDIDCISFPITKAILVHYFMTFIHPFIDGNGRVSRAMEALILHHYGKYEAYFFPITARFYYQERKEYFSLLRSVDQTGTPMPFIKFALHGLHANLTGIKEQILDKITKTLIMDYAHDLRRQKKLLKRQATLLDMMFYLDPISIEEFWNQPTIKAIYFNLSHSTRKRDISNLAKFNFIKYSIQKRDGGQTKMISVNWDAMRFVTLRLDVIPHRP